MTWVLQLVAVDMLVLGAWMVAHRPQRIYQTETYNSVGESTVMYSASLLRRYTSLQFSVFRAFGERPIGGRERPQPAKGRKCEDDTPFFVTNLSSQLTHILENVQFRREGIKNNVMHARNTCSSVIINTPMTNVVICM